jgi:hypothetical protein
VEGQVRGGRDRRAARRVAAAADLADAGCRPRWRWCARCAVPAPGPPKSARATPGCGALGQAANGAAHTATFLGERYHRIARRRGKTKAQVAVARSILVIIWHLLANPEARFTDLSPG